MPEKLPSLLLQKSPKPPPEKLSHLAPGCAAGVVTNEEREQTLNQLLSEMDGFEPDTGVVFVAATNRAGAVRTAALRCAAHGREAHRHAVSAGSFLEFVFARPACSKTLLGNTLHVRAGIARRPLPSGRHAPAWLHWFQNYANIVLPCPAARPQTCWTRRSCALGGLTARCASCGRTSRGASRSCR
jgi:hypothetical protein